MKLEKFVLTLLFCFPYIILAQNNDSWNFKDELGNSVFIENLRLLPVEIDTNFIKKNISLSDFKKTDGKMSLIINSIKRTKKKKIFEMKIKIVSKNPNAVELVKSNNHIIYFLEIKKIGEAQYIKKQIKYVGVEI